MPFYASIKYYFHRKLVKHAKFAEIKNLYISFFFSLLCELSALRASAVILTNNPSVSLYLCGSPVEIVIASSHPRMYSKKKREGGGK